MFEFLSGLLAILAFPILWSLTRKCPRVVRLLAARCVNWSRGEYDADLNRSPVYSAETPSGREAEFIDDRLPQEHKIVFLLRAVLVTVYFLAAVYLYLNAEK
jgi:hypothetical protein